ncbi:hypothetical protein C8Q78DRAFT_988405 [Trametes maxima]|nr:hypothetical protein C8Q78DRAFT_988405 [Trametes maxima]
MFSDSHLSGFSCHPSDPPPRHISSYSALTPQLEVGTVNTPAYPHSSTPHYQYREASFEPHSSPHSALPSHHFIPPSEVGMRSNPHYSVWELAGTHPTPPPRQPSIPPPHPLYASSYSQFAFNPLPQALESDPRIATEPTTDATGFHTLGPIAGPADAVYPLPGPSTYTSSGRPITRNPKVHEVKFGTSLHGRYQLPDHNHWHGGRYGHDGPRDSPTVPVTPTPPLRTTTDTWAYPWSHPTSFVPESAHPPPSQCWENPVSVTSIPPASYVLPSTFVEDVRHGRPRSPISEAYPHGLGCPMAPYESSHNATYETVEVPNTSNDDVFSYYVTEAAQATHHHEDYPGVDPPPCNTRPSDGSYGMPDPQPIRVWSGDESSQPYSTEEALCSYEADYGQAPVDEAAYLLPDHYTIELRPQSAAISPPSIRTSARKGTHGRSSLPMPVGGTQVVRVPYSHSVAGIRGPQLQLLTTSQQYLRPA